MRHSWIYTCIERNVYMRRECTKCGLSITSTKRTKRGRWYHIFTTRDAKNLEPRGRMPKCEYNTEQGSDWSDLQGFG